MVSFRHLNMTKECFAFICFELDLTHWLHLSLPVLWAQLLLFCSITVNRIVCVITSIIGLTSYTSSLSTSLLFCLVLWLCQWVAKLLQPLLLFLQGMQSTRESWSSRNTISWYGFAFYFCTIVEILRGWFYFLSWLFVLFSLVFSFYCHALMPFSCLSWIHWCL